MVDGRAGSPWEGVGWRSLAEAHFMPFKRPKLKSIRRRRSYRASTTLQRARFVSDASFLRTHKISLPCREVGLKVRGGVRARQKARFLEAPTDGATEH